ncbi:hypothetical protein [Pseudobutyrivibrio sp. YE44]|uniref:hypothetical protein n=1 Tax=Pseudobutyrivibrio sp. YE44 TaxID=1520802 RepID=UPI000B88A313|nr:hypothetical protein [Pseudobutyrivibrio sp. YE44]
MELPSYKGPPGNRDALNEKIDTMSQKSYKELEKKYTMEDIKKAYNTLLYGVNSNQESYESIMDIPDSLLHECLLRLDRNDANDKVQHEILHAINHSVVDEEEAGIETE